MSYQTPFSQELTPGNYRINMPSPVTDASGIYIFTRWQDGNTDNPRTINLQTDLSFVAEYTKQIGPFQGQTPFLEMLEEGSYTISMPTSVIVGSDTYRFKQWEDGSTNTTRQIILNQDMSLLATYELSVSPPPIAQASMLPALAVVTIITAGSIYLATRKKKGR